jgi:hypothetical protein
MYQGTVIKGGGKSLAVLSGVMPAAAWLAVAGLIGWSIWRIQKKNRKIKTMEEYKSTNGFFLV